MDKKPLISIVIPARNGEDTIRSCFEGIFKQTLISKTEVIVLDSASTDATHDICAEFGVKVHHIEPKDFNHGDTRNVGVELAQGEFIVMTTQDATPSDEFWLETMLQHFDNPEVAGVCGQQIVAHDADKNPIQWFRPMSEAKPVTYQFKDTKEFTNLSGKQQHAYCNWDDVNAMYRKSAKTKLPFKRLMFSEDTLWAKDALSAGYAIVYDYRARVYHYHHQDYSFYFKRSYIILYSNYKFYGYITKPKNPLKYMPQVIIRILKEKNMSFGKKMSWIYYNKRLVTAKWVATLIFAFVVKTRGMKGVEASQKHYVGLPPQGVQSKK